jgi:hypothetical protein
MKRIDQKVASSLVGLAVDIEALYVKAEEALEIVKDIFKEIDDKRQEAAELMDGEASDAEQFYDDKSEKWQEGERGSTFAEWRDQLRFVADDLSNGIEWPDLELERPDWASDILNQDFEELPE